MKIRDLIKDLKPGLKPFFIFVVIIEIAYTIVAIIFGYPMMIIADKIRMRKYYKERFKTNQEGEFYDDQ